MITIKVSKNIISVQETEPLTSGSVSVYKCRFVFDASWDGFFRSAVFRVGSLVKTAPLDAEDMCDLPWELLEKQYIGLPVEVSVYGTKEETEILPTIWDKLGRVRSGSEPGEDVQGYSPSVYDRIAGLVKAYSDKTKGDKGDKGDPGEGDMNAAVYDPQGRKTDAFQYADEQIARIPNPNLLHNWYFANPVNQRGQTEYSGAGYGIDRWRSTSTNLVLTLVDGGIKLVNAGTSNAYMRQPLELPLSNQGGYVWSVLCGDVTGSCLIQPVYTDGTYGEPVMMKSNALNWVAKNDGKAISRLVVQVNVGGSAVVRAIKLELGSTQTLAHQDADGDWVLNEIPDCGSELLKCQRYYQLFSDESAVPTDPADYRPNMRTTPATGTVEIDGATYWYVDAEL